MKTCCFPAGDSVKLAPRFKLSTTNNIRIASAYLVLAGACLPLLLFLALQSCANSGKAQKRVISGTVREFNGAPIHGATIRVQNTQLSTTSRLDGGFTLPVPEAGELFDITSWAPGYFIGGPVQASPGDSEIELELRLHPAVDNPNYKWRSSLITTDEREAPSCAVCHSTGENGKISSLPADEWKLDAHANSARNQRFLTMYLGTDIMGNQSPLTRYINKKDYGNEPIKPDLSLPYYGPGYKLDFPETAGNCAACHAPAAAVYDPYDTDPTELDGAEAEGVSCDFCHKIWDVVLDPESGLPFQNMPGVLSYQFRRPPEGSQFFAGPLDDVAPGEDVYSRLQTQSQYCAGCHFGVFWDVVVYDSFGEWLRSPYSDPESGQTCQDCHMPHLGASYFALPEKGGLKRDTSTIFSHRMPGASDEDLLQNAVSMTVTAALDEGTLQVEVTLVNDLTGHSVPTDSPLRHMILLVSAEDEWGVPLTQLDGPRLPDWCGVGNPREGRFASQPGMVYAKVLAEQWSNISPSGAYWNPTYLVSDNRLAPFESDSTKYNFKILNKHPARIDVRLLYRRAFIELALQKGWQIPDILMEEIKLEIVP